MPFVSPPFAMTNWTPQTRQNKISITSYNYDDKTISGFIGTHQPAIWMGDYGYVTVVPASRDVCARPPTAANSRTPTPVRSQTRTTMRCRFRRQTTTRSAPR